MKVDGHKLGLAGAVTSAIIFTACSIIMHFWPASVDISAAVFHLSSFGPLTAFFDLNAQIFVSGLIQSSLYTYIYLYVFVYVFNYMGRKR